MPVIERFDEPGTWHHCMNRGLGHRTIFERSDDYRYFESRLAKAVRRGHLEVHAYSLMPTHFHVLARSTKGLLSRAWRDIERAYAAWFNRTRDRDGPLFRSRFRSKAVQSDAYVLVVVRYLDYNPVDAGLVKRPSAYRYGSARYYMGEPAPPWLDQSFIKPIVAESMGRRFYDPGDYESVFVSLDAADVELVEQRFTAPASYEDVLGLLASATSSEVKNWMLENAAKADGTASCLAVTNAAKICRVLRQHMKDTPRLRVRVGSVDRDGWRMLEAGLLRVGARQTVRQIAQRMNCGSSTVQRLMNAYDSALISNPRFRDTAAEILVQSLPNWR